MPEQSFQSIVKLSSEDLAEYMLGEEEPGTRGPHPSDTAGSKAPGGHDTMQVRMMHHGLSPRVQHAEKADLRAEALGVRRHLQQRGRSAAEQQIV